MDKILTPGEKGKIELERLSEQKRQLQQAEDEERDLREKQRRLKQREAFVFLMYLRIFLEDEKLRQEREEMIHKMRGDFLRQYLAQAQLINRLFLDRIEAHDASVSAFVFGGETEEERQKRDVLLKKADMNRDEFSTLAMACLSKDSENKEDVEKVFSGKQPSERLTAQRKQCLDRADRAVSDLGEGKIEEMEAILKDGLANACHIFCHTKDPVTAIHWSKQINGILSIANSHPVLFKNGVASPLLETAAGMAAIGRVMENGLRALDELHLSQLMGNLLPAEKETDLHSRILLMHQADSSRSNEQFQKFFARGYDPKAGLQQENLKNLLKKLHSSQAIYTLSVMDKEERVFALSDSESRKILSEDLFVPHAEKSNVQSKFVQEETMEFLR